MIQQAQLPHGSWQLQRIGASLLLHYLDRKGQPLLSLGCSGSPVKLKVRAASFRPIGSEDRFMLGLGDEPVTLVADLMARQQSGVSAEGPVPEQFAVWLENAKQLTALYNSQEIGPLEPPRNELKRRLAEACAG